jgi:hypothetical protein
MSAERCAACHATTSPPTLIGVWTRPGREAVCYALCDRCALQIADPGQRRAVALAAERNLDPAGVAS